MICRTFELPKVLASHGVFSMIHPTGRFATLGWRSWFPYLTSLCRGKPKYALLRDRANKIYKAYHHTQLSISFKWTDEAKLGDCCAAHSPCITENLLYDLSNCSICQPWLNDLVTLASHTQHRGKPEYALLNNKANKEHMVHHHSQLSPSFR